MIQFQNVSKKYSDGTNPIQSLNMTIKDGEFFVIIGPSGSGKTTTLKMINRLIDLSDGTVLINNKRVSDYDIHELRWNIGYVLQQIALFPHMTIAENIAVVPELKKWSKKKIKDRIDELLTMVGLDPITYRDRKPNELSGGQQQRVGVLRALAADPEILLMDEPFSALDPFSREKLQDDLLELQRKIKKTIVFVTHDMYEAMKLGDRIGLMKDGQLVQVGTPFELLNHPANEYVHEFVSPQQPTLNLNLKNLICPFEDHEPVMMNTALPITASLQEVMNELTIKNQILVENEGQLIGMISRQSVIQYLAQHLQ